MKLDDWGWHIGGGFPEESPEEYGAVHMGLFLKWAATAGYLSELVLDQEAEFIADLDNLKTNKISGTNFLLKYSDGKLFSDDMNENIRPFVEDYYNGQYLSDLPELFQDLVYHKPEEDFAFDKLSAMIERRLGEFQAGIRFSKPKPKFLGD